MRTRDAMGERGGAAGRDHRLDAEDELACRAVGKDGSAAGIGREIAADGAGPLRRQQLRIEPVHACRRLTRPQQRDAGLAGHGVGNGIDLANAVEAVEREHDLAVLRDLPAHEAGIAALWNDGSGRFVRELEDAGDLRHRTRPQHDRRVPMEHVAHFQEIGRLRLRIGDGVLVAHDRNEAGQEIGRQELGGGLDDIHHAGSLGWTRPDYSASSHGFSTSCARGGRPCEAVIDRFAQARVRDWHHRDGGGACGIERAQVGEQVGGRFDEIAARRQIEHQSGTLGTLGRDRAEGEQRLARLHILRVEPQPRPRGVVGGELSGRHGPRVRVG